MAVITACVVDIKPSKDTYHPATPVTVSAPGTAVTIGEIYENCNNVQNLYDLLGGTKGTSFAKITAMATATTSAADIRAKTYNKTANQDVQVTFGGLVWDVVYLSTTSDNRPILTLWLNQSIGESPWNTYTSTTGDKPYPAKMYSTSYLRAVTLNNGGSYATSETNLVNYQSKDDVMLSRFTVDYVEQSLTSLLVKPQDVLWQEQQYAHNLVSVDGDTPNDGYNGTGNYSWATLNKAVAANARYGDWAGDYCWLPSFSETLPDVGIWRLNTNQTSNPDKTETWLRSGDDNGSVGAGMSFCMFVEDASVNNDTNTYCTENLGVRPALHLDLSALDNHRAGGEAHLYSDWELTTEPTCADGEYTRVCQNCGYVDRKASPAVISHHSYGDWEIVSIGGDTLVQRRTCAVCGSTKERTTPPYQHQITIESNYTDRLVLTTTLYTEQTTVFTAQDWLNYLNRLTDFDDIVCRGTVRYFDLPSERWCTADVSRIEQYDNNMFTYCYPRSDGVMVAVRTTITHLTLTATVQDLRTLVAA